MLGGILEGQWVSNQRAFNGQNENNLMKKIKAHWIVTQSIYFYTYMKTSELIKEKGWINFPCNRIKNNLCRYSALKEGEHNSSLFRCGLYKMTFFQRIQHRKSNFTLKKLDEHLHRHHHRQVNKVNIDSEKSFW